MFEQPCKPGNDCRVVIQKRDSDHGHAAWSATGVAAMGCRPHLGLSTAACRVSVRRFCGGARIDTYESGEQADRMNRTDTHLDAAGLALFTDSLALLSAARRLELNAGARAAAGVLPLALALVEETLYALDDTRTALRAAGHRCGAALELVATTIPVAERTRGDRRQLARFT